MPGMETLAAPSTIFGGVRSPLRCTAQGRIPPMKIIGLVGWSGAGKTTLLVKLIPILVARGLTVSTIKHAHHAFDVDKPGKDSYEHRAAGAREVLVASAARFALMHELRGAPEPDLGTLLAKLSPCDLVLIEGFKRDPHPKIEVHREANGKPYLFRDDPAIVALASDVAAPEGSVPRVHLDDADAIAALLIAHAMSVGEVRRRLAAGSIALPPST